MGRPRQFDRQKAVDTAMQFAWRHGLEACSVKALAEHMGITRSSFYHAFGGLDSLLLEVMSRYAALAPDRVLKEPIGASEHAGGVIHRLFRDVCRARAQDPRGCMAVNAMAGTAGARARLRSALDDATRQNIDGFRRLVERGMSDGSIRTGDSLCVAMALQCHLAGLNLMSTRVRDEEVLWQATECVLLGLGIASKPAH